MPMLFELLPEPVCISPGMYDFTYQCPRCEATWNESADGGSVTPHICKDLKQEKRNAQS